MSVTPQPLTPLRVAAIAALQVFGATNAGQARTLLPMWKYYGQMSRADVAAVVDYFAGGIR